MFHIFIFRAEDNPESIFSDKQEKKRSRLLLPQPQISDAELEDIIKIGHASDSVRELVDNNPTRFAISHLYSTVHHALIYCLALFFMITTNLLG
jgi:hypothetical protein